MVSLLKTKFLHGLFDCIRVTQQCAFRTIDVMLKFQINVIYNPVTTSENITYILKW